MKGSPISQSHNERQHARFLAECRQIEPDIHDNLQDGCITMDDLVNKIDAPRKHIREALKEMERKGEITAQERLLRSRKRVVYAVKWTGRTGKRVAM